MTLRYAVGIKIGNRADQMTVEAEDALIAALKVKTVHPETAITYVRKRNARGDRRHPHSSQIDEDPAGDAARSRSSVRTMHHIIEETMPEPVPKPPGRPPAEPIIIKNLSRPPERPEIERSPDQEEEPEIKVPPEVIPEMPPVPGPGEQAAEHSGDRALRAGEHLARRSKPHPADRAACARHCRCHPRRQDGSEHDPGIAEGATAGVLARAARAALLVSG
jgi:hypothetical protein